MVIYERGALLSVDSAFISFERRAAVVSSEFGRIRFQVGHTITHVGLFVYRDWCAQKTYKPDLTKIERAIASGLLFGNVECVCQSRMAWQIKNKTMMEYISRPFYRQPWLLHGSQ